MGVTAGLVFASVLVGIAWQRHHFAQQQREIALASQLIAQSRSIRSERKDLLQRSVLLSVEALLRWPSREAYQAVYEGLVLLPKPALHRTAHIVHNAKVNALALHPNGRYLASATVDGTVHLWNVPGGGLATEPMTHDSGVVSLAFSPDGLSLATVTLNGIITIWDLTNREAPKVFQSQDPVNLAEYSPSRNLFAIASMDGNIELWDLREHRKLGQPLNHGTRMSGMRFSSDGRYLITVNDVTLESIAGEVPTPSKKAKQGGETEAGQFEITEISGGGDHPGQYQIWDVESAKRIYSTSSLGRLTAMSFSIDGQALVRAIDYSAFSAKSLKKSLSIINWVQDRSSNKVAEIPYRGDITTVALSPDGRYLLVAGNDPSFQLWDVYSSEKISAFQNDGRILIAAFSSNGRYIATVTEEDNSISIWETGIGGEVNYMHLAGSISDLEYSHNGKYIVSAINDRRNGKSWTVTTEANTNKLILAIPEEGTVVKVVFSPDDQYYVTGVQGKSGTVNVRRLLDSKEIVSIDHGYISTLSFSPNGKYLATHDGNEEKVIIWQKWETSNPERIATLPTTHSGYVEVLSFSPDSKYLAIGIQHALFWDDPGRLMVWEFLNTANPKAQIIRNVGIKSLTFSPSGKYLAAAGDRDNTLILWEDWATTNPREVFQSIREDSIGRLAFSPEGQWLATTSGHSIHILDVHSHDEVAQIKHNSTVFALKFSPGSHYLTTGTSDGNIHMWLYRAPDIIQEVCGRLVRNLEPEKEWKIFLGDRKYRQTCPKLAEPDKKSS